MADWDDVSSPVAAPASGGDWDSVSNPDSEAPKAPNVAGVQKMAQDNLAAADKPEEGGEKDFDKIVSTPIQSPEERLNTATGLPVGKIINGTAQSSDINAQNRAQYVSAIKDGSADTGSDWMQTMLHAITPTVAGVKSYPSQALNSYIDSVKGAAGLLAYPFVSDASKQELLKGYEIGDDDGTTAGKVNEGLDLEKSTIGRAMGGLFAPISAPLSPIISPAIEATGPAAQQAGVKSEWAQTIPKAIGAGMDVLGMLGVHEGLRSKSNIPAAPWDDHPGAEPIKNMVATKMEISPDAVSSQHIDQTIGEGSKNLLPAKQDFKDVATVMDTKEEVLHDVYKETGVHPAQVFEDAQNDPAVAADIKDGKVPEAYEHLKEPESEKPEVPAEKLSVEKSDTAKAFNVVDEEGNVVNGGFDSAEEAKQHIEDKTAGEIPDEPPEWKTGEPVRDEDQSVIPGAEKISDKDLAERKMDEPKRASVTQKDANEGLFDTGAQKQGDIFDKPSEAKAGEEWATHEVKLAEKAPTAEQAVARKELEEQSKSQVKDDEPELADGHVRLYRGESFDDGKGAMGNNLTDGSGLWYTPDRLKAEKYGDQLRYVDIPNTEEGWNQWARGDGKENERVWGNPHENPPSKLLKTAEAPKEPIEEPKLPKELSGAKPRYGYKDKQFTLKFDSDVDRAAYIAAQDVKKSKADSKYVDFLKKQGMDDKDIADLGAKVKDKIKAMAKDGNAGELSVSKTHELSKAAEPEPAPIEKSQKPLTSNAIPPSEIGKPTSLSTFIKNNGGIKPDEHEASWLKQDHKDLLKSNGKTFDEMGALAHENGYFNERPELNDFAQTLQETNGGREHFRGQDNDRVLKAQEAATQRAQEDPAFIEHEASRIGMDTEPHEGETAKQTTKRLRDQLSDFYRNAEGTARVRDDAGQWLLENPIQKVQDWTGKLTGGFFQKLGEGYVKTFQPELMGDKALRADAFMAKYKTTLQEAENQFYRASEKQKAAWDKTTTDERMQWLYDHETGRWDEQSDPDHARYQALMDGTYKAETEAGVGAEGYKDNYLQHQWEDPEGIQKFFNSDAMIKKYGKGGYQKASTFQLIQDGVRAGFKLKTDNPESMLIARLTAGKNMMATMDLLHDMHDSGLAVPTKAFSVDKRISDIKTALADAAKKYNKASDAINDPKQLKWDFKDPAVSKYMKGIESRVEKLNARLDDANKERASYKNLDEKGNLDPELKKNGFKVIGPDNKVWNIHNEVGPIWKNAMDSKGLWENQGAIGDAYRFYTAAKAVWVRTKLALSLFHPFHEAMIDLSSDLAVAQHHLIQGGNISDLMNKQSLPNFGLTKETAGLRDHPLVQAWNTPESARTPEQQYSVTKMLEGGFKPTMSARDTVHFKENWDKAINGVGLNNLRLIASAAEIPGMAMKPFMEHWIPGMKAEMYDRATELALKRDPSLANDSGKRGEAYRDIAKNVDKTYGELNQDTLFWNKTVRDSFNAAFISGGWKLALINNARGLLQPLNIAAKYAKTGEFSKSDITLNMLQAYNYTALTLATGAAAAYMLGTPIRKGAKDIWDVVENLVSPQSGDKNPDGTPIRLKQPAFAGEAYSLAHDITTKSLLSGSASFLYHQTLIPGIADVLQNQDFTGRKLISDPTDLNQWMNQGWDSIAPISWTSYDKADAKGSDTAKVAGVLGFPPAGAYMNQTPFEQKVLATYDEQNPPKGDAYQVKLKGDLRSAVAKNDTQKITDTKAEMKKEGMTDKQIEYAEKPYTKKFVDTAWSKLPEVDKRRLIESASDEEKQKFKLKGAQ